MLKTIIKKIRTPKDPKDRVKKEHIPRDPLLIQERNNKRLFIGKIMSGAGLLLSWIFVPGMPMSDLKFSKDIRKGVYYIVDSTYVNISKSIIHLFDKHK